MKKWLHQRIARKTASICIFKLSKFKLVEPICLVAFSLYRPFWNQTRPCINTVSALCENEDSTLSDNQNAGLPCKMNNANEGVEAWTF